MRFASYEAGVRFDAALHGGGGCDPSLVPVVLPSGAIKRAVEMVVVRSRMIAEDA